MWQQWWISKAAVDGEAVVEAAVEGTKVEETTTPYPRPLLPTEDNHSLLPLTTIRYHLAASVVMQIFIR